MPDHDSPLFREVACVARQTVGDAVRDVKAAGDGRADLRAGRLLPTRSSGATIPPSLLADQIIDP